MRTFFSWASLTLSAILASCAVYSPDQLSPGGAASSGSAGIPITGGQGGGSHDAGTDVSSGAAGGVGSSTGTGGTGKAGSASTGGTAGKGGTSGAGGGGTGGSSKGGSAGAGGSTDGGGSTSGSGGTTGGGSGAGGASGAGGTGATTGGASGAGSTGGSAGTGGTGGAAGTGGVGGASGTGGTTGGAAGTGGTVDAGQPPPGAVFAVGSFTKNTATGSQTIAHTLGEAPKAILLWTNGKTNESASPGYLFGIGVTDTTTSMAIAAGEKDAVSPSSSSRRMAAKAITLVQGGEVTIAEADLSSVSAANFVLNWTTNDAQPYVIHYIAIGGPQAQAKVVNWQMPTGVSTKTVTGVPFTPELVLHFYLGAAFLGPAPDSQATAVIGIGAMDAAGEQWANQAAAASNQNPTVAGRAQKTDSCIYTYTDVTSSSVSKQASIVGMTSTGFSMNFTTANSSASQVVSLALAGVKADIGNFNKSASTGNQSITTGFQPGAVFLASYQSTAQSGSVNNLSHNRLGIGASDGTHEGSSAVMSVDNVSTAAADGIDKTSRVFVKVDNTSNTTDAEADLASLDPNGFTLGWAKNDSAATQICYIALGAP